MAAPRGLPGLWLREVSRAVGCEMGGLSRSQPWVFLEVVGG